MAPLVRLAVVAAVALIDIFAGVARAGTGPTPGRLPIEIAPVSAEGGDANMRKVIVEPGDHLWSISEGRLRADADGAISRDRIPPYWREVVETNRDRIRSGNPDLIFPGEVILLPAPDNG